MEAATGVGSSCQKGRVPHHPPEAAWGLVGLFAHLATRGPFLQEDQANYFLVAVLIRRAVSCKVKAYSKKN